MVLNSRNYRLFDLGLRDVALSFVGATSKDDLKAIRALQAEHGKLWPGYWLRARGPNAPIPSFWSLVSNVLLKISASNAIEIGRAHV